MPAGVVRRHPAASGGAALGALGARAEWPVWGAVLDTEGVKVSNVQFSKYYSTYPSIIPWTVSKRESRINSP